MAPRIKLPPKEELGRLYHQDKMTMRQIGEQYGTTAPTILYWLRRYGIKTRGKQEATTLSFEQGRTSISRGAPLVPKPINGELTCKTCKEKKPISEFRKRSDSHGGYSAHCKECALERGKQFRLRETMWKRGLARCSNCLQWLPVQNFRENGKAYGEVSHRCRRCSSNNSEYHDYLVERDTLLSFGKKYCPNCDMVKAIDEFGIHTHMPDGLQGVCKSCKNKMTSDYYQSNQSEILERERQRRDTIWGREQRREAARQARQNNPEPYRERVRARRKLIEQNGGDYSYNQFLWLLDHYCPGKICPGCGKYADRFTADHVIPITWGGTSYIDNIQPLCWRCNSRKGNKSDADCRPDKGAYAKWVRENVK